MDKKVVFRGNNIHKIYSNKFNQQSLALKNINVTIYANDFTVIMGPAGAGKSSLLYALSGLDPISSGSIHYGEDDLTLFSEQEKNNFRKKEISFIPQKIQLLPDLTVLENVALPSYLTEKNKKTTTQRAKELLAKVGLVDQLNCRPGEISRGQQQLVVLARSFIQQPNVLFADEPTGDLNTSARQEFLTYLSQCHHQTKQTIILATNDLNVALRGNRILYLEDGLLTYDANLGHFQAQNSAQRKQQLLAFLTEWGW